MKLTVNRGKITQILAAAATNLLSILFGFVLSWTSPAIALLQSEQSPLDSGPITIDEASLMTALMYVGCCMGAIVAGWLANTVGRRISLLILVIPQLIGFILIVTARNVTVLYISRIFSGFSGGSVCVVYPIFTSEIADKSLRGVLGNFLGFGFNFGCLAGKCLTTYGGFYATPIAVFVIIGIFGIIFLQIPDTPQYLLLRDRHEDAERSLKFYRGISKDNEMSPSVVEEFSELKKSPSLNNQNVPLSIEDFKGGPTILAILISFLVGSNPNFSGNRILIAYTEPLLANSGSLMDTAAVDVAITGIQVIVALASIFIVNFGGFRKTLLGYYVISCLSLVIAGIHYFLHEMNIDMSGFWWLIFMSMAVSVSLPSTALTSIAFALPAEILPTKIRGIIISFFMLIAWIIAYLYAQFYFPLTDVWGHSVWMWIFAFWCFFGVLFTYFLIPETRGKTFDEVLTLLNEKIPSRWKKTFTL
ncbi:hypothetical protein DMENIID0001_138620 [Sergentomyia squamirostris]